MHGSRGRQGEGERGCRGAEGRRSGGDKGTRRGGEGERGCGGAAPQIRNSKSEDGNARAQVVGILAGATLLLGVGILDDRRLLHHQLKLFVAIPLAALILIAAGIQATVPSSLFPFPFSILPSPSS